jgi:hypothetical protein
MSYLGGVFGVLGSSLAVQGLGVYWHERLPDLVAESANAQVNGAERLLYFVCDLLPGVALLQTGIYQRYEVSIRIIDHGVLQLLMQSTASLIVYSLLLMLSTVILQKSCTIFW